MQFDPARTDGEFVIRRCRPEDEAAVYEVCLRTGEHGEDARHLYDDPLALGHIFVGPYMRLEPRFAFVLASGRGVCGYALAALDSERFYENFRTQWLPPLRAAHAEPTGDPARWTPTQKIYYEFHHPRIYFPASLRNCPSHLHIDLLPRAQGHGWGTRMMWVLLAALTAAGSPGVHLAMSARNIRAARFYRKLGFVELERTGTGDASTIYLGRTLS
ncbi:MAG: GNAT family N-acetyltransferase [Verrucomicrobia bacterium]|nr:GNAT family N-acetyltransferase [Verrucomicrobiota bacterium]